MRGNALVLKEFVWKTFEDTGNIDSYMFFKEIEESIKTVSESKIAEEEAATSGKG